MKIVLNRQNLLGFKLNAAATGGKLGGKAGIKVGSKGGQTS